MGDSMQFELEKLEIGCGQRPTPGYIHNDINPFENVDIVGPPWEIGLPDACLREVIALGVMEHLTYEQFDNALKNIHRMLGPAGVFLFDVPDIPVWCRYVADHFNGRPIPVTIEHAFATLYGWQRWQGDEHKSGWHKESLDAALRRAGFATFDYSLKHFLERGLERNRMTRDWDAHLYVMAVKT
jgi:predicted SAM-dependent methyltransferase